MAGLCDKTCADAKRKVFQLVKEPVWLETRPERKEDWNGEERKCINEPNKEKTAFHSCSLFFECYSQVQSQYASEWITRVQLKVESNAGAFRVGKVSWSIYLATPQKIIYSNVSGIFYSWEDALPLLVCFLW